MPAVYVDSSALVKLAVQEAESTRCAAISAVGDPSCRARWPGSRCCGRSCRRAKQPCTRGRVVLRRIDLVRVSDRVLELAGGLEPPGLRSLDAIHLATARRLGRDLGHVVTYDERMLEAASELGIRTASPD